MTDTAIPDAISQFARLETLKAQIKALEAEAATLTTALIEGLFAAGETAQATPTGRWQIQSTARRTLKPEILIARGVSADLIAEATIESASKPFLRFYPLNTEDA